VFGVFLIPCAKSTDYTLSRWGVSIRDPVQPLIQGPAREKDERRIWEEMEVDSDEEEEEREGVREEEEMSGGQ
jgi:hypothetical protein